MSLLDFATFVMSKQHENKIDFALYAIIIVAFARCLLHVRVSRNT